MYGAVLATSRSCGVLNAPGGVGAPGSFEPGTCGTSVLCRRLSVRSGPEWHEMQPALPWNRRCPRSAVDDIVPRSNDVTGGSSERRYAASAATRSAVGLPSLKKLRIRRAIRSSSDGCEPVQKYSAVSPTPHRDGGSRGPVKSPADVGCICV